MDRAGERERERERRVVSWYTQSSSKNPTNASSIVQIVIHIVIQMVIGIDDVT